MAIPDSQSETIPEPQRSLHHSHEAPKSKTWVLRVSIHCEGCRRKVKKVLTNIEGVSSTDIDLRQQKVTVVGNVGVEVLLRKLNRAGRHAEMWPQQPPSKGKNQSISQNSRGKEKQSEPETPKQVERDEVSCSGEDGKRKEKAKEKGKAKAEADSQESGTSRKNGGSSITGESSTPAKPAKKSPQSKKDGEQDSGESPNRESEPPASDDKKESKNNPTGEATEAVTKSELAGGKKKRKGQKGNTPVSKPSEIVQEPGGGREFSPPPQKSIPYPSFSGNDPRGCQPYPPYCHYSPPIYAVSYSTAQPTYRTSYYSVPPPYAYAYAYMHHPNQMAGCESDHRAHESQRPSSSSDTFELFSDENPNACSIM